MGKLKRLLKQLFSVYIVYLVYTICWAFLFIYIEECLPEQYEFELNKKEMRFINHIKTTDNLSIEQKEIFINISSEYFQSTFDRKSCNYGGHNFLKWWEFAIISSTTIGLYPTFNFYMLYKISFVTHK